MIGFILFSIALLVVIMWLIAPALLGKHDLVLESSKQINIAIARERLAELDAQLKQGDINQAQYDQSRNEVESALLDDADAEETTVTELPDSYKRNVFLLLTVIPFVAFGLYQYWGEPEAIAAAPQTAVAEKGDPHAAQQQDKHNGGMEEALAKLRAKLEEDPNNAKGWFILARTYMVQKEYELSTGAYRQLRKLVGDQPDVLLGLADAITMSRGGDMSGEPFELSKRALTMAPDNVTALWLTGLGYQDNGDLATAVSLWKKLLPLVANDPESTAKVQSLIDQAQRELGTTVAAAPATTTAATSAAASASIEVAVQIDAATRNKVQDTDYVMIYAQRVQGMKMPLAMVKAQVKDLPMKVTLNDSLALSPMNKLSNEQLVNVIARISKSSQATRQAGDIETVSGPHPVSGSAPVTIVIRQ